MLLRSTPVIAGLRLKHGDTPCANRISSRNAVCAQEPSQYATDSSGWLHVEDNLQLCASLTRPIQTSLLDFGFQHSPHRSSCDELQPLFLGKLQKQANRNYSARPPATRRDALEVEQSNLVLSVETV